MWQLPCIATWGRLTPRQSLSAIISSHMPSLKSLSLSVSVLERFYCWYVTLCCDRDLWPLTVNVCSILAVPWSNYVPNLSEIEQSAAALLRFEYSTLWPWTCITCCTMLRIVCTKFKLSQAIRSRTVMISETNTLCHAMILTFDGDPLTLKVCGRSGVTWS